MPGILGTGTILYTIYVKQECLAYWVLVLGYGDPENPVDGRASEPNHPADVSAVCCIKKDAGHLGACHFFLQFAVLKKLQDT
jgi:hypothetical protein